MSEQHCIACHGKLTLRGATWICLKCNSEDVDASAVFMEDGQADYVFIDCHGASMYEGDSNTVVEGVMFDDQDSSKYEIVGKAVYAPNHNRKRRIKKDAVGKIRRCQACQDLTVRLRRREGADFYIPSVKHPSRKTLKKVEPVHYEP
ncbi:MAG: hypothetical protein AAB305_00655 [Candidatus Zixiibacteriota bacterium]